LDLRQLIGGVFFDCETAFGAIELNFFHLCALNGMILGGLRDAGQAFFRFPNKSLCRGKQARAVQLGNCSETT
jgi:hypothetical protein